MIPVAILAGGLATRLRPITETLPKSLIEVSGEPFIAHQLRLLRKHGVRRVVLCVGHLAEKLEQFVGDGSNWDLEVLYSSDGETLQGTGGALKRALPMLEERFFVIYGDSYLEGDYKGIADAHESSGKLGLMTVLRNDNQWDRSNVAFREGQIVNYDKANRTAAMTHIDWGLGVLRAEALSTNRPNEPFDLAEIYRKLLAIDQLTAFEVHRRFYEIGSAEGIRETEAYLDTLKGTS